MSTDDDQKTITELTLEAKRKHLEYVEGRLRRATIAYRDGFQAALASYPGYGYLDELEYEHLKWQAAQRKLIEEIEALHLQVETNHAGEALFTKGGNADTADTEGAE